MTPSSFEPTHSRPLRAAAIAALVLGQCLATSSGFALSPEIHAPQVIAVANAAGDALEIAWQDKNPDNGVIHRARIVRDESGYRLTDRAQLQSQGLLAGFALDAEGNRYHMSAASSSFEDRSPKPVITYKNDQPFWNLLTQEDDGQCKQPFRPMLLGSSQITVGADKLFYEGNLGDAHTFNVMLGLNGDINSNTACAQHKIWHHNFGQRTLFDGQDFVVLELRDHEMTLGMQKFSPSEAYPYKNYFERMRSVYSRTNYGNSTFTKLGGLQLGYNDGEGYLVLFSSERDRDYLMRDVNPPGQNYIVADEISARDLAVIHVRRDFDQQPANWRNPDGTWFSMSPQLVDATLMVDSAGESKTTTYRIGDDGWDWPNYSPQTLRELQAANITEAQHRYAGVKWLTSLGEAHQSAARLPDLGEDFSTVANAKLGRFATNRYVAIWEEYSAKRTLVDIGNDERVHYVDKSYRSTKAAVLELSKNGAQVVVTKGETKDLGKLRLNPYDEPVSAAGKVLFFTYADNGADLVLSTLDASLDLESQNLMAAARSDVLTANDVLGTYQHNPVENDWHRGRIWLQGEQLNWQNDAGVRWTLTLDPQRGKLLTDDSNPYYDLSVPASLEFKLSVKNGKVTGFSFMNADYVRVD